jgi:purine-binding chemotaxis protein CheW
VRGKIAPVVDLRKRLNLRVSGQTQESRIVVIDIDSRDVGVIVDGETEVLRIPLSSVEPPAQMLQSADSIYLKGIAKIQDKLVILLDMSSILSEFESISMDDIREEIAGSKQKKNKCPKNKYITV